MGKDIIEEVMGNFEEQTNKSKEEHVIFGDSESGNVRMLGTWLGHEKDTKMRLQRASKVWPTVRKRFLKCKLSKVTQAKVFEACVEGTMLFNIAVRPFLAREIKSFQRFCDKKYRYIWSDRKGEPLRQMQEYQSNMADIRNQLQASSIRTKIEVAHLTRMGHILRLPDESLVKQALLGWLTKLEGKVKAKKKTLMIVPYWRRLIKEAGMEVNMIDELTSNHVDLKVIVQKRQLHMEEYERQQGKTYKIPRGTDKIDQSSQGVRCDDAKCLYKGCNRVFRTRAALTIHQKRLHRDLTNAPLFVCPNGSDEFKQEGIMKNHYKRCDGERTLNGKKECRNCMKWISKANFARHRLSCGASDNELYETHILSTRTCRINRTKCKKCDKMITVANMARHQKSKACL